MERIKQALQRAYEERQAIPYREEADEPTAPDNHTAPISYTATHVFEPKPRTLARHRILTEERDDEVVGADKVLRTQVLKRMTAKGWNALAVTRPGLGEGKTLTSINLAISLAREVNHTVLLVDLDLRSPSV